MTYKIIKVDWYIVYSSLFASLEWRLLGASYRIKRSVFQMGCAASQQSHQVSSV